MPELRRRPDAAPCLRQMWPVQRQAGYRTIMRCIAIDVMGGDKAPQAIMDGVASALAGDLGDFKLLLVGLEDVVKSELQRIGRSNDPRVEIVPATQVVGMDEPAVAAIRSKKDSSLNVAAELVKEGRAQAFFSAGNTGALVSSAVLRLRNLPGIQKPAIAVTMPTTTGEFRSLSQSGKDHLTNIQKRETERTGISSLKIGYNNVFGYYLEVTNIHKNKVPPEWSRKQTLTGAERYITEELKEYEQKIIGAEDRIQDLETTLFAQLIVAVSGFLNPIKLNATIIARIDCLVSFAVVARKNNYARPSMNDTYSIDIKDGRHPVIEQQLAAGEPYIPNDVYLDQDRQQVIIITGPNMSGKSALLRQTALIVLMAQMGSFVPAEKASIGIVDKVFTRVGASDNISSGESTFMVEMNETASILNNVSSRSLILLDEIGRGTSTYDGISIAWAITEYLHEHPAFRAKVMFATHYHELNEMAASFTRIRNYHVSVKESGKQVIFLRKLKKGGSEHSFGIHVATMAGMPRKVIDRANKLLSMLEKTHSNEAFKAAGGKPSIDDYQLSFIQLDDPLLLQIKDEILNTNIDTLTPVEALLKLHEIRKMLVK